MPGTLLSIATKAAQKGELLVLQLQREPTQAELMVASIVVVQGLVVKNRIGREGDWSLIQKDLGGQPLKVVIR